MTKDNTMSTEQPPLTPSDESASVHLITSSLGMSSRDQHLAQHIPLPLQDPAGDNPTRPDGRSSASQSVSIPLLRSDGYQAAVKPSRSCLLDLPNDLVHVLVKEYLPFSTLLKLRLTCKSFAQQFTLPFLLNHRNYLVTLYLLYEARQQCKHRERMIANLNRLRARLLPQFGRLLPNDPEHRIRCYGCLHLKPKISFSMHMVTGGLSTGGPQASGRMCKICLVQCGRVRWGRFECENPVSRYELLKLRAQQFPHLIASAEENKSARWRDRVRQTMPARRESNTNTAVDMPERPGQLFVAYDSDYEANFVQCSLDNDLILSAGECTRCGCYCSELWWGCVGCLESEEKRLQARDRQAAQSKNRESLTSRVGKKILGPVWKLESWVGELPRKRWVWMWSPEYKQMRLTKRHERLRAKARKEYERNKHKSRSDATWSSTQDSVKEANDSEHTTYAATQHQATERLRSNMQRRQLRCAHCWTPDHPARHRFATGLARDRPLPEHRWCAGCKEEKRCFLLARDARKQRRYGDRFSDRPPLRLSTRVSETDSERDSLEGFVGLFD